MIRIVSIAQGPYELCHIKKLRMILGIKKGYDGDVAIFAVIGMFSGVAIAVSSAVALVCALAAMASRGLRHPIDAVETLICLTFPLGMLTGAMPFVVAKLDPDACMAAGFDRAAIFWATGCLVTCMISAMIPLLARPRLAVERKPVGRWLWLLVATIIGVLGCLLVIGVDTCALEGGERMLIVPAFFNAVVGFSTGGFVAGCLSPKAE